MVEGTANRPSSFFIFTLITTLLLFQFYFFPALGEKWYGESIYPIIRGIFDGIMIAFNQSLALLFIGLVLFFIINAFIKRNFIASMKVIIVLIGLFYWLWGFNYFRVPLSVKMNLKFTEINDSSHLELTMKTLQNCIELSKELKEETNDIEDENIRISAIEFSEGLDFLYPSTAKVVPFYPNTLFLRLGILGMYFPFTGQAQYETELTVIDRSFTKAHEWCHAAGIAPEHEADFLAYLICIQSDNKSFQYSANMHLLYELLFYYKIKYPEQFQSMIALFSERMNKDIEERRIQIEKYSGPISEMSEEMIDQYLKMNNQRGIEDYHRLSDYVFAWNQR